MSQCHRRTSKTYTDDLSLFYPKSDVYDLKGYSDVDYPGDLVNRTSTSGMVQFLDSCLIVSYRVPRSKTQLHYLS